MDQLSENRDPIRTLQYALALERGQENYQKMSINNKNNNDIDLTGTKEVQYIPRTNIQQRTGILRTPKTGPIQDCWKCGYNFVPSHLYSCPAEQELCRICNKTEHYAKMFTAEFPPTPTQRTQQRNITQSRNTSNTQTHSNCPQNTRKLRNINMTSPGNISPAGSTHSAEN